jgi:hypothetical protein
MQPSRPRRAELREIRTPRLKERAGQLIELRCRRFARLTLCLLRGDSRNAPERREMAAEGVSHHLIIFENAAICVAALLVALMPGDPHRLITHSMLQKG